MVQGFGVLGKAIYTVRSSFGILAEKYYSSKLKLLKKEKEKREKDLNPDALWRIFFPKWLEKKRDDANRAYLAQINNLVAESENGREAGAHMAKDNIKALDELSSKMKKIKSFLAGLQPFKVKPLSPSKDLPPPSSDNTKTVSALARARSEANRIKEKIKTSLASLNKIYGHGTKKLKEYFEKRKEYINTQFQAEMEYLQKKKDAEKDPDKRLAIEDEIFRKEQEHKRALIELTDKQTEAEKKLAEQKQRINQMLDDIRLRATSTQGAGDLQSQFQAEQAEMDDRHQEEIERLNDLLDEENSLYGEHINKKAVLDEAYRMQKLEKDKLLTDQNRRLQEYQLNTTSEIAGGMADIFTNLYDLTGKKQKEFFYLAKAAALAQAIINTSQAVTKALAQGGIMGPVLAATIAAQGAVQIATITAQGLAAGGTVLGWSPNDKADNVLIRATAGEFVMPVSSSKYYGESVMQAIRTMKIPRSVFAGLSLPSFTAPAMPSYSFADGGQVPAAAGGGITIVNVTDPREIDAYLAGSDGQNAILNVLSSRSQAVKRILTG